MPDDAADEALHRRHPFGRVEPGWCMCCGEYGTCARITASPLDDPPAIIPPVLAPLRGDTS